MNAEAPVFSVHTSRVAGKALDVVDTVDGKAIKSEWLPDSQEKLSLRTPTLPPMPVADEVYRMAKQEGRGRLFLELELPGVVRSEAPTRIIGELLSATQNTFDAIALGLFGPAEDQAKRGRISSEILAKSATDVLSASAASFAIELGSTQGEDLFEDSPFSEIVKRTFSLLDTKIVPESMAEILHEIRPRGANRFRNWITVLAKTGGAFTFIAATSAIGLVSQTMTRHDIETLQGILDTVVPDETFELRGPMALVAFDVDKKRFGVRDEETSERYEGKVAERAVDAANHATANEVYDVIVTEYGMNDETTGERRVHFVLEQLAPMTDSSPSEVTRTLVEKTA